MTDADLIANMKQAYSDILARPQRHAGITGQTTEAVARGTLVQATMWEAEMLALGADRLEALTAGQKSDWR